jgi:hypothetical protein
MATKANIALPSPTIKAGKRLTAQRHVFLQNPLMSFVLLESY